MKQMFSWNALAFSVIQWILAIWFLVPLPFLNPTWTSGSSQFTHCWSLAWNFEHYFTSMWDEYQLRLSAKCHFQGLKTGLCLVPTGLRASPTGNQHWWRDSVCVCVCVCVCAHVCAQSLLFISNRCVFFAPIHCGPMERESFAAWSAALSV